LSQRIQTMTHPSSQKIPTARLERNSSLFMWIHIIQRGSSESAQSYILT